MKLLSPTLHTLDEPVTGASDKSARAGHEQSPQAVSAVPVTIPSADDWVVVEFRGYDGCSSHEYGQVSDVCPKTAMVKIGAGRRLRRVCLSDVIVVSDLDAARALISKLDGAYGELLRRKSAALEAYRATLGKLYAQGIDTRSAETGTGSVHESPIAESDAPDLTSQSERTLALDGWV